MFGMRGKGVRLRAGTANLPGFGLAASVSLTACVLAAVPAVASGDAGDLDQAFGLAAHGRVAFDLHGARHIDGVAVQPGGGIVAVGDTAVVRLRADGTADPRFGAVELPGLEADATAAVAQPDGRVVVAGTISGVGAISDIGVWRLTTSGALDTSFGGGDGFVQLGIDTFDNVASVGLDSQARIVVTGTATTLSPFGAHMVVARFTPDGDPDASFNNGQPSFALDTTGNSDGNAGVVQSDDKIVVTGTFHGALGLPVLRVTPGTLTTPATLDHDFGGGDGKVDITSLPQAHGYGVAVDSRGRILALGEVDRGGVTDSAVVRLTPAGDLDHRYGAGSATPGVALLHRDATALYGQALTLLPAGGVAVVGSSDTAGVHGFVAKLRASGAPDPGLGPRGIKVLARDRLYGTAGQKDGRILAVGYNPARTHGVVYRFLGDLKPPSCAGKSATIVGTHTADKLIGTRHPDVIAGLGGRDSITGLGKGDIICGGPGHDHLIGGPGDDKLLGGTGRDTLVGGHGADHLIGGPGHDHLKGGAGPDTIKQ